MLVCMMLVRCFVPLSGTKALLQLSPPPDILSTETQTTHLLTNTIRYKLMFLFCVITLLLAPPFCWRETSWAPNYFQERCFWGRPVNFYKKKQQPRNLLLILQCFCASKRWLPNYFLQRWFRGVDWTLWCQQSCYVPTFKDILERKNVFLKAILKDKKTSCLTLCDHNNHNNYFGGLCSAGNTKTRTE